MTPDCSVLCSEDTGQPLTSETVQNADTGTGVMVPVPRDYLAVPGGWTSCGLVAWVQPAPGGLLSAAGPTHAGRADPGQRRPLWRGARVG